MKLVFRSTAVRHLDQILAWIAKDNPQAAIAMVERIEARLGHLAAVGFPESARRGRIAATRELVEPPYVIVYRVYETRGEIHVLAVLHGARQRR